MGWARAAVRMCGVWSVLATAACGAKAVAVAPPSAPPPPRNAEPAEVVRYCSGTVTEWDEHRCIWELTPEQQRHRSFSQRLTIRGGKLIRFETITGSGALREDFSEYTYDGESIVSWRWINRNGVDKGGVILNEDGDWARWVDAKGRPSPKPETRVSGLRRRFDARGRVLGYVYVDALGNPAAHSSDVFEKRVKLNQAGAVVQEDFFGQHGEPVLGPAGAHVVIHEVDAHGLDIERRYLDIEGQPMLVDGVGIVRSRYDEYGNPIELSYFNLEGLAVIAPDEGAAVVQKLRDERGNEIERRCFDALGKPVFGAARGAARKQRFDAQDAVVELSYTGANGSPARPPTLDYAIRRQTRDERGNVVAEYYFDEHAAPVLLADGYHAVQTSFDARDNPIAYAYLDTTGAPVVIAQGYQARRLTYDVDRPIRTEFLDLNGKSTLPQQMDYEPDGSESKPKVCQGQPSQPLIAAISARAALSRSCYERLLAKVPNAKGSLLVGMRIEEDGAIARVSIIEDHVGDEGLAACVKARLISARFPRGPEGGCADVNIPLRFEPKPQNSPAHP